MQRDSPIDYRSLFYSSPAAFLVLSPELDILEVSDAYLKVTMTQREQIIGRPLFEVFPDNPDDPKADGVRQLRASLSKVISEYKPHTMEIQKYDIRRPLKRGGGFTERYWSPTNTPVLGPNRELLYIIHSVQDVTGMRQLKNLADEQKQVPAELRTSDSDLASVIVDEMYQFVALLDKEGRLLEVNRPALEGTGLNMADVRGEFMWEVPVWNVTPENFVKVKEASLRGCRGEFVREELLLFAAAGGREAVTIDFSIKPVRDSTGKIVFMLAEGRNITERKIAEAELERKSDELAKLNLRLRELDQLKTEFFANVSHELRTPLSLILGPVQKRLASNDISAEEQEELLLVERNARLLLKHVNDLLDISRLEAHAMAVHYVDSDFGWLARFVASFFEGLAKEKSMTFKVDVPLSLKGQFDLEKLQRVLLNLLSNAFKFAPTNGVVSMSLASDNDHAYFIIEDDGSGIPVELLPVVFERFRQVESSSTRQYGGTGLGLSIVKEFVNLHKGEVNLENVAPHGLRVRLKIPLSAPPQTVVKGLNREADIELGHTFVEELGYRNNRFPTNAKRIDPNLPLVLVVEDNEDVREFLKALLTISYRVIVANNGQEGLVKARSSNPSLIIADVMMPQMSGEEMVDALHREPGCDDIPILMLSARADDDLRIRLLEKGVQDFVTKPFVPKELLARVLRLITERKNAQVNLKHSEEKYRSLVKATTSLVWATNQLGEIEEPQPSWQQFTGQGNNEIIGLGWFNAFHPEDREQIRKVWLEARASGEILNVQGRIWNVQHGMYRHFVARGISLKNSDGSIREWFGSISDVHEKATMEQRLKLSVLEKETLLKEIHHRVKNNMQIIASLLRLQSMSVEEKKLHGILEESQQRIRAMALVHEKLYQSQSLSRVDFGDYLRMLVQELFVNLSIDSGRVALELDIENIELGVSRAIPCGLLINELLSNSLKHAFPNGRNGTIKVTLKRLPNSFVHLSVEDNGNGLPRHVNPVQPVSLGLEIVNTLAKQLGSKIICRRNRGVCWLIDFASVSDEDARITDMSQQMFGSTIQ